MMESIEWIEGTNIGYGMGVDGISIFCTPVNVIDTICILASWEAIEHRVREYMVAFLILETMMVECFAHLIFSFFTSFLKVFSSMFIIIGVWEARRVCVIQVLLYTLLGSVLMLVAILVMYFMGDYTLLLLANLLSRVIFKFGCG